MDIVVQIQKDLDLGKFSAGLFLDFKRAFETVNHEILLSKLEGAGVRGPALEWFRYYLRDRTQFVHCNGINSGTLKNTTGVPQGSVLGPYLFLVFINDLALLPFNGKITLFADDTSLFYSGHCADDIHRQMQLDLNLLCKWLARNQLLLNPLKSNYIIFRKPASVCPLLPPLIFNGKPVVMVQFVKFLGLYIDEFLHWDVHIDSLIRKLAPLDSYSV